MNASASRREERSAAQRIISRRPTVSLLVFVIIVVAVSVAGYARYQHVQAEISAQQTLPERVQKGFSDWREDLSLRLDALKDGVQGTTESASNSIGGALGIGSYLVKAALDFVGNLHIMIPVVIIYFGIGFFGTLKMRVATLIGGLIAFWMSTNVGIVQGSVVGLFAIAALLLWNRINPRTLNAIQNVPTKLRAKFQQLRGSSIERSPPEPESAVETANARE